MDAIKKKMQAMKLEKDNAISKAETFEIQAKDANHKAEKAEEEVRDLERKVQTLENSLYKTQEKLDTNVLQLEEKEKVIILTEGEIATLNAKIQLLEDNQEKTEARLASATQKLAESSQDAEESERMRKMLENRSCSDEEKMEALVHQLKDVKDLAEEADKKYSEVSRKLVMVEADLDRSQEKAAMGQSKIVELEVELRDAKNR